MFSFTVFESVFLWFIFRLMIGVGDHALHFSTQTWITAFSPPDKRGRNISFYGLSFGAGFAAGPLLTRLVDINENLPFLIAALISFLAWVTVFFIKNEYPDPVRSGIDSYTIRSTFGRFGRLFKYAWAPLLPAFAYGVLEASLNGNFPVYGLRVGLTVESVTLIIAAFSIGAIIFQLPLGIISDKLGRRRTLVAIMIMGSVTFIFAGIVETNSLLLAISFFIAGMLTGSTYSLSIAYLTDTVPKSMLPAGNLLIGICFSFGSISGPFLGGVVIDHLHGLSFLHFISIILFMIFFGLIIYRPKKSK